MKCNTKPPLALVYLQGDSLDAGWRGPARSRLGFHDECPNPFFGTKRLVPA